MSRLLSRSSFGGEVSAVRGNTLVLGTGAPRAIVATSSLNFGGLAPEQQRAAELGFRELINGQSGPIQLYLRIRRRLGGPAEEPVQGTYSSQRDYLAALTRSFVNTHLDETPVFERTTFLVLGSFDSGRPLLRSWRFHFDRSRSDPVSVATDAGQSLATRATTLAEQLRRIGIKGQLLQDDSLERLLTELYRSGGNGGAVYPSFVQRRDGVEIGGRPYASFVVDRYPGEEIESGWLLPLLSFKGELHIGIHIIPLDTDRMIRLLQHRIRDLRADEMVDQESGAVGRASLGTLPDALSMHQSLARNEEKVFAVSFYLTVGADDPKELQTSVEALRATCRRMMLHTVSPYFEMRQALLSSWPFGTDLLGREQILQTSAVLTMFPWLQDDLDDGDGHYWGYNKDTGGLCVFDPFDEGRFPNANIAVMAHSGAGKTYAAASVVLSGFTRDVGAIVLDPEAEYGGLVRSLGGTYVHLATGSGHAINVLDPLVCAANADEPSDQLSDVLDFIGLICGHLDEVERAQVEMVIRRVVAEESSPVLADVWQRLERAEHASRISTILARWVSGDLGRLFSSPTNLDLASPVVGFNLRDMSEELIGPAYLVLANWLWMMLRRDPRPRHLLIDEAGLLLEHEPIRRFLIRLARRIRKYRGSLILVSQNPGDFFDTKDGAVLATNPSILLLGSQKHSEALKLQKAYSLTERQVNYLETAQRGDFLLVAGLNRVPVHIMAPPWMDEMIVASRSH